MNSKTKKITILALLSALAFITVLIIRIPMVSFLSYEPKDVIIVIAGFIFNPLSAFIVSVVVSFLEMISISADGFYGFFMNIVSTCAFAIPASLIYKKFRKSKGAIGGLVVGVLLMSAIMILWNFIITPLYMGLPRESIVKMLLPVFLPFNLVKGGLNMALTLLLYKPVVKTLRKLNFIENLNSEQNKTKSNNKLAMTFIGVFILFTCVLIFLSLRGII